MPMYSNRSHCSSVPVDAPPREEQALEATKAMGNGLVRNRHPAALQIHAKTTAGALVPGLLSVIDVCGRMGVSADWGGRTLPANVVVLSVTTSGEIASDKDDCGAPVLALTGVATRAASYAVSRDVTATLGLLDPRWLRAVFGLEAATCTDRRLRLADVLPASRCDMLRAAMRGAATAQARTEVLQQWLRDVARDAQSRVSRRTHPSDEWLGGSGKAEGPKSLRQRERLFLREHGVSMSRYASIERFQQAVVGLVGNASGAALALDAGYTDQSHMCRSVRAFSGLAPTQLKQRLSTGVFTSTYAGLQGFGKQLVL